MDEVPPDHVAVGRAGAPWGVRGVIRVVPLAEHHTLAPGRTVTIGDQRRVIESARPQKGLLYVKLSGIDDRDAAAALRERLLTVPESDLAPLPDGQYYRFQLIDLAVTTSDGAALGRLTEVITTGANDVYVVRGERGEVLVPATAEVVKEIDLAEGRMVIEALPGLIPEPRRKK